jgi:predicted nucleic acid-binding Zn ribbon protein
MADHNQKTIKQAIEEAFQSLNIKNKIDETRLITSWEKVMGKVISKHTRKLFVIKGTLFIYLDNPALKNELTYSRDKIIELVNESAGEELVKEVVIK